MRKESIFFSCAAFLFLFGSCSNDEEVAETAKCISVSSSIGTLTRATVTNGVESFSTNDKISVYVWTGSSSTIASNALVVNNSINTYDGVAKWTAEPQMLWKDMVSAHYFMARYPQKAITDFTTDEYTLNVDKQEESDVLVALNTGTNGVGCKATNTAVPLQFDHVMANLIVNLTFRNQWGVTPVVTSVKVNAKSKATVNYLSKTVTATGTTSGIVLPVITKNASYQSIMVPQSGVKNIIIAVDGKNYTYTNTDGLNLEAGKYTQVNLIVGRDSISMGNISINSWGKGNTINNGEAQDD